VNAISSAAKPEGADCDVQEAVRIVFGRVLSCFSEEDSLVAERQQHGIRVAYTPGSASPDPRDPTVLRFSFCCETNEMWIGSLSVAAPFRSSGLGCELVQVAEETARRMGIRTVNVFPYVSVASFWEKMGYQPHPCTARVLTKHLSK